MASWLTPVAACPRALTCSRHASLHKARQFSAAPEKWGAGRPPADKRCNPGRQDEPEGRSGQPLPFPPPPAALCFKTTPTFSLNLEVHRLSSPVTNSRLPPADKEDKSHGGQLGRKVGWPPP